MSDPIVEAMNVVKLLGEGARKVQALKGVSLKLTGGEMVLLMGPSGSGKTTLLSVLGCILSPNEGSVRICGHSTLGLRAEALAKLRLAHIGFVFQTYHLFPTLTAIDNVRLALEVGGERPHRAVAKAKDALALVGLAHKIKAVPLELSSGEQQRVAIARAMVGNAGRFWPTSRRRRWTTRTDIPSCRCSPRSPRLKTAVCWSSPTMGGRCLLLTGLFASTTVASSARNNVSIPRSPEKRSHCKDRDNVARTLVVGGAMHSWRGSDGRWSCAADRRSGDDRRQEWR